MRREETSSIEPAVEKLKSIGELHIFGYAPPKDSRMPGGMYRNQCWFPYPGNNVVLCLGIHGQMIYVNRAAEVVGAKLSSWPVPQDAQMLFSTIRAFDAVSAELT